MKKFIEESAQFLKERGFEAPEIGIILGTGLGQFVDKVEIISSVSYNHIPNFPTATVEFREIDLRNFRRKKSDRDARTLSYL